MPVKNLPVEVNSFVGGLVTEASPLTFPENASLSEDNFVLNRDGSRKRRLGMDVVSPATTLPLDSLSNKAVKQYEWENAGGSATRSILVIQTGTVLSFFDSSASDSAYPVLLSTADIKDHIDLSSFNLQNSDMTSVDGTLVVVVNERDILVISFDNDTETFSFKTDYLKVRDLFGREDPYDREAIDFNDGTSISAKSFNDLLEDGSSNIRPYKMTDRHLYNLRNQSWGRLRDGLIQSTEEEGSELSRDPIDIFREAMIKKDLAKFTTFGIDLTIGEEETGIFPSNADTVATGLIDYTEKKGAPERFSAQELGETPRASSSSAKGFFIIDALKRGRSREEKVLEMLNEGRGEFKYGYFDPYNSDLTPRGATCLSEFAGRVWYSGFTSEVIDGDSRSPKMASFVLFSQLVKDLSNITNCYQKNDPTFEKEADLLATDGGFIRLDGAYGIKRLVNLGSSLAVFAENGVWTISGGTDQGFTAEAYIVKKIDDKGALGSNSFVTIGSTTLYWGEDGIYSMSPDQFGAYVAGNISKKVIQTFFEDIPIEQRVNAYGIYDKYENTVRWLYGDKTLGSESKELILNLDLNAFSTSTVKNIGNDSPVLLAPVNVPPFRSGTATDEVVVDDVPVVVDGDEVVVKETISISGQKETLYLTLCGENPVMLCYSSYSDLKYRDWYSHDNVGVDAEAFLITGYGPQGDFQRRKQVPYITNYLLRTEDGFEETSEGVTPKNQSSCLLQARWEWANSPNGNKWGRSFETYRYNRFYMPEDIDDGYDTGDTVIVTKNKLRGHGRTLSLKYTTSPTKDCRLLGWSMIVGVSTSV